MGMLGSTPGRCHHRGPGGDKERGSHPAHDGHHRDTAWPRCLHGLGHPVGTDTPSMAPMDGGLTDIPPSPQQFRGGFHLPIPSSIPRCFCRSFAGRPVFREEGSLRHLVSNAHHHRQLQLKEGLIHGSDEKPFLSPLEERTNIPS